MTVEILNPLLAIMFIVVWLQIAVILIRKRGAQARPLVLPPGQSPHSSLPTIERRAA